MTAILVLLALAPWVAQYQLGLFLFIVVMPMEPGKAQLLLLSMTWLPFLLTIIEIIALWHTHREQACTARALLKQYHFT